jgi:hypothetical protein
MGVANYPATLPARVMQDGFSRTLPDGVIRFTPDAGSDKTRLRSTEYVEVIQFSQEMDESQVEILKAFYWTTCASGAYRFDWTHPITGTAVEMKFRGPPNFVPIGMDYRATIEVEVFGS